MALGKASQSRANSRLRAELQQQSTMKPALSGKESSAAHAHNRLNFSRRASIASDGSDADGPDASFSQHDLPERPVSLPALFTGTGAALAMEGGADLSAMVEFERQVITRLCPLPDRPT